MGQLEFERHYYYQTSGTFVEICIFFMQLGVYFQGYHWLHLLSKGPSPLQYAACPKR